MSRYVIVRNGTGTRAVYTCVLSCVLMTHEEGQDRAGEDYLKVEYVSGSTLITATVELEGNYVVKMCQPDGGLIFEMTPRNVEVDTFTALVSAPETMVAAAVRMASTMEMEDWWDTVPMTDPRKVLFNSIPDDMWIQYALAEGPD